MIKFNPFNPFVFAGIAMILGLLGGLTLEYIIHKKNNQENNQERILIIEYKYKDKKLAFFKKTTPAGCKEINDLINGKIYIDQFFNVTCHEIKKPFQSIILYSFGNASEKINTWNP